MTVEDIQTVFLYPTPNDIKVLEPFYAGFAKSRKFPRYDQSPLIMLADKRIRLAVIDNTLVSLKQSIRSRAAWGMPLPPMNADGDTAKEREIMVALMHGIGAYPYLTDEDLEIYGITETGEYSRNEALDEWVYRSGDVREYDGKHNKMNRYTRNTIQSLQESGRLKIHRRGKDMERFVARDAISCFFVAQKWHRDREKVLNKNILNKTLKNEKAMISGFDQVSIRSPWPMFANIFEDAERKPPFVAFTIGEGVGDNRGILTMGLNDYDSTLLPDFARATHWVDCEFWNEASGPDTMLNMGAASFLKGLQATKAKLRPVRVLKKFRVHPVMAKVW